MAEVTRPLSGVTFSLCVLDCDVSIGHVVSIGFNVVLVLQLVVDFVVVVVFWLSLGGLLVGLALLVEVVYLLIKLRYRMWRPFSPIARICCHISFLHLTSASAAV